MLESAHYTWQHFVSEACAEADLARLLNKISEAEYIISTRMSELPEKDVAERKALEDALRVLDGLRCGKRFVSSDNDTSAVLSAREHKSQEEPVTEGDKPKYGWQQAVREAEASRSSPETLPVKINIAERRIAARLRDDGYVEMEERLALKDALRSLATLDAETGPQAKDSKKKDIA